jgi:hypothetical protein
MKFRKKPVVIEAMQFIRGEEHKVILWAHEGLPMEANSIITRSFEDCLNIRTLEGTMLATPGDWIIKGVKGEFYPVKDDIFHETYEAVEGDQ